jgi:ABC-2 type transport system ATP-binding protein
MIELIGVSKTYGGKVKALDNVSLNIDSGCIYGFLGPNGAGKTTAIKLITGILRADGGQIRVGGIDIEADPLGAKKRIGYVPDSPDVFLRLKGIEYLSFMADIYGVGRERRDRIESLAERFEMTKALGDRIQSYSHGMRQKIVLIGAMLHRPKVWILDEPMTGLDPKAAF